MKLRSLKIPHTLSVYFGHLYENLPMLILANVLFVLFSIPIVTMGSALIALNRISCAAVSNHKVNTFQEFFKTWKREFKSGLLVNLTFIPLFVTLSLVTEHSIEILLIYGWNTLTVIILFLYFLLCSFMIYLFPLLAYMNADGLSILKNSLRLFASNGPKTLFGGVVTGILFQAGLISFPYSFPIVFLLLFSLITYNSCFFGWHAAVEKIFKPYYRQHSDVSQSFEFLDYDL